MFRTWVDFDMLEHDSGPLYRGNQVKYAGRSASNSIGSERINLTSLAFGMTTELFAYAQTQKNLPSNGVVLDAGCGEPSLFNLMANSMYFPNYIGVDIRESALLLFGDSKNVIVIADDLRSSDAIRPGTIDVIVFCEVLEHFAPKSGLDVLFELYGWLKEGGKLILTTPIKPVGVEIDMDEEWEKWDHITYYEADELTGTLEELGFEVVHKTYHKFIGRRMTYRRVRKAFVENFGHSGEVVFDHVSDTLTPRLAGAVFAHWAGDQGGHIQLVLEKLP